MIGRGCEGIRLITLKNLRSNFTWGNFVWSHKIYQRRNCLEC